MNDIINEDVIEKVVIKSVAIYKAMSELSPPPFEDKFVNKENICQQNEIIQSQNLEKCLKETEPSKENEITDTTSVTKKNLKRKSWKGITDPKLREKMRKKDYYENNKEKINNRNKAYRKANKEKTKEYRKNYNELNKEKQKIYSKQYRKQNKSIIKEKKRVRYQKEKEKVNKENKVRYNQDINYKLKCRLRHRLRMALKKEFKSGSSVKDLGCNIDELKTYLESKFLSGMSWDNWTTDGWHIDHIKPLASFDLTDRKQFLEACHYTNLQPLWAKDNIIKSDNII